MRNFLESAPTAAPAPPPETLSSKARLLYESMREVGQVVGQERGYVASVSVVHFFCPGEIAAAALGMARSTLYRKLEELEAAKLIEARAHYVTHEGRTKADGMVWAVKMHPERQGRVRVPYDALKLSYRCLSADIEAGRTAWALTRSDSQKDFPRKVDIKKILAWALPPPLLKTPLQLTVRSGLEAVLDVPYADQGARGAAVDGAARALAASLGDNASLMFYRWLIWQLLRLSDQQQGDYWHKVHEMARRASGDAQEGFARKAGALFTARLKTSPFWDHLARASGRVGPVPLKA